MTMHFKPSRTVKPNNRVRINGGSLRSRVIEFPDVDGLRPTANRVRETLFNWLGQSLHDRRCLDLFAGSGALGFEAASRGAAEVAMVENNRIALAALARNREKLGATVCRVVASDAADFLARSTAVFDVVFLDPPFASGMMAPLLAGLQPHLAVDGVVYAEWGLPLAGVLSQMPANPWRIVKQGKGGVVHFALLSLVQGAT